MMNQDQSKPSAAEVKQDAFRQEVLLSAQPVLVAFGAPWSRPCHVLAALLDELAAACTGKVKVCRVNADDSLDLSLYYDIQSIPTLLYFVGGKPLMRIVGTASTAAILAKISAVDTTLTPPSPRTTDL